MGVVMGRPKGDGETPKRNVRVPDEVWEPAKAHAKADHTDLSKVIVAALRQYGTQGTIPLASDLVSREIAAADARAAAQRRMSASPQQAHLSTYVANDKALLDSAEVSRLLRILGAAYGLSAELGQVANQLDAQALLALDEQRGA